MSSIQLVLLVCLIFLSQRGKGKLCAWSYSVLLWPEIPGILKSSKTDATIAVTEATATAEKPESHFRLSPTSSFPQLWEIKIFDKNRGGVASHFLSFFWETSVCVVGRVSDPHQASPNVERRGGGGRGRGIKMC